MKKSHIPLIIGDILMFIAVAFISYPNMVLRETMATSTILLCCVLVLSGMCMVLAPFVFEHIENKQKISKDTKKTKENIDLIFENLSALQSMIADTREANDNIEEKLAFQLAKDTDIKFEEFQQSLLTLRDNVKNKIAELRNAIEQMQNNLFETSANAERNTLSLEEIKDKLKELSENLEYIQENNATEFYTPTNEDIENITGISDIDENSIIVNEPIAEPPEQQNQEQSDVLEDFVQQEQDLQSIEDEHKNSNTEKLSGLMSKALSNAMSTAVSVEKIISASLPQNQANAREIDAQNNNPEPSNDVEENIDFQDLDNLENQEENQNIIVENSIELDSQQSYHEEEQVFYTESEYQQENNSADIETQEHTDNELTNETIQQDVIDEQNQDSDELLADLNFDDDVSENELSDVAEENIQSDIQNLDIDEYPLIEDKPAQKKTSTQKKETTAHIPIDEMLFADVVFEKKRTISKKDTLITLNALIGIGNKPYLRGDNATLNIDKGIAMDYVEIGVWRAVLPQFEGDLNFSIWKNDEEQIGENTYKIQSGNKQEITI